jgi:hypothetical protein
MSGGVILGDWTHRRGDVGGGRAVSADIGKARPRIAWTFRPPHGGNVDQVRIAGELVYVATMAPGDPLAPAWEHAILYAIEATTGRVAAVRPLPDPVPVAAMLIEGGVVHILATRPGEPIFWYALDGADLRPRHRHALHFTAEARARGADVLEAWASADGGIWMELEGAPTSTGGETVSGGRRTFAFAKDGKVAIAPRAREAAGVEGFAPRDACCVGHTLYAPSAGDWDGAGNGTPPSIWQLDPVGEAANAPWASTGVTGPRSHVHAVAAEGAVSAVAVAADPTKASRALVQAMIVDRVSGVVRIESNVEKLGTRGDCEGARLARRPNGDIVFQCTDGDGRPVSDVWRTSPSGEIAVFPLPREPLLLDAALGDALLAHAPTRDGRVLVSALDIDKDRLLGRRAQTIWSIETPDLGGSPTVYAGAGHVLARGAQALTAIRV